MSNSDACDSASNFKERPIIGRFNSWLLEKFEDKFHEESGPLKEAFIKDIQGTVVEIGPGNGINFRYYPQGVNVIAIEPNTCMHERLNEHAQTYNVDMELRTLTGDRINVEDNSVDAVVCTLVLCTVPDPAQVIKEAMRVLKPGGKYIFVEHVAAPDGSTKRKVQNILHGVWHWLFDGCHTNRDTATLLEAAGFSELKLESYDSAAMPPPLSPQIYGCAVK